jgi:asparagine synthase (glutamine-hydrolysing)
MCGIAGIYDQTGAPVNESLLRRMTDTMQHRGPDGVGTFIRNNVGLGHRRLSIIDIGGGAQPMGNEDDSIQVVFNGEIYNYIELRNDLLSYGHIFKTQSDTEVIVHAYEQWGLQFADRLNGMFSFAIYDANTQKLILARDHLGIKPLYFTTIRSQFLFASEIKSLMQHPEFQRELDREALTELFTFRYVPSPKSLVKGVFKLPPGHFMTIRHDQVAVQRFWNQIPSPRRFTSEEAVIEEYQHLLDNALGLQLRSDVPLGLFLSSGIDSGVLMALMSQKSDRPIEAFTVDFEDGQGTNEATDAAVMAKRHGANHHCITVSSSEYEKYFERYMGDIEEPVGHEAAPAFYFLAKLASSRVKVALTGQGADEPWAGYARYVGVKLSKLYSSLPLAMTQMFSNVVSRLPLPSERLKRGVVALPERDVLTRFIKIYSFFSAEMKAQLYNDALRGEALASPYAAPESLKRLQKDVAHLDPLSQILYIDTRTSLPDDLLMVGDKTSMANSLEVRVPFLDRRLVELIETLPPELKLRGITGKYLHKKALLKWLPHQEVYRQKKGFANPINKWMKGPLRKLVDDCLLSRDSMLASYFNQDYIKRILEADRQGRADHTRQIYLLLSLELWHRTFFKAQPAGHA